MGTAGARRYLGVALGAGLLLAGCGGGTAVGTPGPRPTGSLLGYGSGDTNARGYVDPRIETPPPPGAAPSEKSGNPAATTSTPASDGGTANGGGGAATPTPTPVPSPSARVDKPTVKLGEGYTVTLDNVPAGTSVSLILVDPRPNAPSPSPAVRTMDGAPLVFSSVFAAARARDWVYDQPYIYRFKIGDKTYETRITLVH